jgi:tRNA pseudouridine55 synthase
MLVVDKPVGVTSHDVVDRVRRRLRVRSAGHLGTLDPGASGLLLVVIGAATRCAPVWQGGDKTYEAAVRFGVVTTTQDMMGEVLEERPVALDEATVREASRSLVGEIEQIPPMVSALKVGGQRLYRLARRGVEVERAPRRIRVLEWEWLSFSLPTAAFRVRCSGGTYVRTLAHDLGQRLGTGGALQSLRRLRSEPFDLERSVTLSDLDRLTPDEAWIRAGIEMEDALGVLPSVMLDAGDAEAIGRGGVAAVTPARVRPARLGRNAAAAETSAPPVQAGPRSVLLLGPDGRALALGELRPGETGEKCLLACPHVVFPWAAREGRA